jgi:hypothetical protein
MERLAKQGWEPRHDSRINLDLLLNLYIHCQEFSLAAAVFEKHEKSYVGLMRFHVGWHIRVYNFSLLAIQNAKKRVALSNYWRKQANKYVSMVRLWVNEHKAINMAHKLALLEAEFLGLQKPYPSDKTLMDAYDNVIVRSARSGFLQDAALAASLASVAVKDEFEKRQYARRAQEL